MRLCVHGDWPLTCPPLSGARTIAISIQIRVYGVHCLGLLQFNWNEVTSRSYF